MLPISKDSPNFASLLVDPFLGLSKDGRYKNGFFFGVYWISLLDKIVGITFKSILIEIIQLAFCRKIAGFKKNFWDFLDELKGKNLKIRKMKFYSHIYKQYTILTSMP